MSAAAQAPDIPPWEGWAAGAAITVIGEQRGTDGNTWYQIQYTGTNGAVNTGYVSSVYVRLPVSYTPDSNFEAYLNSQGFPESYKNGLRQLHQQYPNWVFKARTPAWTGIRSLRTSPCSAVTWYPQAAFPRGNQLRTAPITGITAHGPAWTEATG